MLRFDSLERLGLRVAVMSDKTDGDCAGDGCRRVAHTLGLDPAAIVLKRQVHGADVVHACAAILEADGIVSTEVEVPIAVRVADCVPILLFEPVNKVAAIVHAGRLGTERFIARRAIDTLVSFGARPHQIHAAIGPSAGPCCYEVAPEMAKSFEDNHLPVRGRFLDLWNANAQQLAESGLSPANIEIAGVCTICDGRFHSHRRDADGARNIAILMI